MFENVKTLELDGLKSSKPLAGIPIIELNNVQDAFLYDSFPASGTDIFLSLKGDKTNGITLDGNNLKNVRTPLIKSTEVKGGFDLKSRNILAE
jgi:hypothetical protein